LSVNRYIFGYKRFPLLQKKICSVPAVRKNRELPAREHRVIGENGENLGVLDRDAALQIAEEKGLDLIEISATATPPVAASAITTNSVTRRTKSSKRKAGASPGKGRHEASPHWPRLRPERPLIRARQIDDFSKKVIKWRFCLSSAEGKANKDWAFGKFNEFLELITENYRVIMSPKAGGTGFIAQISKS
jgi:hypothetical protein